MRYHTATTFAGLRAMRLNPLKPYNEKNGGSKIPRGTRGVFTSRGFHI